MTQEVQLFADQQIRTYWDDSKELYYFCIVDVVKALTDSNDPKQYIKRMRQRDSGLNSVWGTICTPHQFISSDGKRHQANCASIGGILRIIQSIPSPKAEPFKRWLAQVGADRLHQMQDPELGIYDQRGTCYEYACGADNNQYNKGRTPCHNARACSCRIAWWVSCSCCS